MYKAMVCPVMTFGSESLSYATTKQMMCEADMSIMRTRIGRTRMNRIPNQEV